ncbi:MAG TPA: SRPBCC family protein [Pyrinomonadaceae bacterium]|nr:SRPBCC family protein [Pyrinomonadaceae bacterium]
MATKLQEIRGEPKGEGQSRPTSVSASRRKPHAARTGRKTRGAQPTGRQDEQQLAGLKNISAEQLARGLGWFSIGLGLAELLAPRAIAKISGVKGNTALIRLFGLREMASGIAIFMEGKKPAASVWSRVAGDALDLAALGKAFASPDSSKGRVAFATANVLAVTALDVLCAQQLSSNDSTTTGGTNVKKSIIINSTPEELYQFWRDFENLPRFMQHLQSVEETGDGRSHWVTKGPADSRVEWDAEVTEDRENELIAWRSLEGSDVYNTGSVRFEEATGGRGTVVHVEIDYAPPGGVIGKAIAKLFGEDPKQQIYDDLRCLKQVIETGEVIISDGTFWDNGLLTQRPARPVSSKEAGEQSQGAANA